MTDRYDHFPESREPDFYLTRLLGPKFAVLAVILVLYLSIRHQLITTLNPGVVTLGLAHAEAWLKLTLFGDPDTITTFTAGGKAYDLTRHAIVDADLFVECWRAVLWQVERGVIAAVSLVAVPRIVWFIGCMGWEVWRDSGPQSTPALSSANAAEIADLCAREIPPPPLNNFEPETVEEASQDVNDGAAEAAEAPPVEVPALPTAAPRKRTRKATVRSEAEPRETPPTPPLVQPGQVRKRPRRED